MAHRSDQIQMHISGRHLTTKVMQITGNADKKCLRQKTTHIESAIYFHVKDYNI